MKIKEKILKEVKEDGEASVEGFDEDMLQFSLVDIKGYLNKTLAEVGKVINVELMECKKMLKENPLNDYWLGRDIVLEKIKQKLGIK